MKLGKSTRRGKKMWAITPSGRKVHFGAKGYSDFTKHKDPARRARWYARMSKIRTKKGRLAINDPESPLYYAARVLW